MVRRLVTLLTLLPRNVAGRLRRFGQVTATGAAGYGGQAYAPTHYYPPPGPPDDPWGPYINEAAARYFIPAQWIRAVMQQESGGEEQAVSPVGAMGLMQLMPETYQVLEASEGLGPTRSIRTTISWPGPPISSRCMTASAHPAFWRPIMPGRRMSTPISPATQPLPAETVNYLAAVTPNLGTQVAFSGPLRELCRGDMPAPIAGAAE